MIEPVSFIKGSDTLVEGWGMPFFGPFEAGDGIGRDFDGEYFSPNTDFLFDWFKGERPSLYQHTMDKSVGTSRLGGVVAHEKMDEGIWTRVQLDLRNQWYEAVRKLVKDGALSFSSGAYPMGVQVSKSGEILRWPWVELTMTPTPANPYASLSAAKSATVPTLPYVIVDGEAHEITKAPEEPAEVVESARRILIVGVKATWSAQYVNDLPDSAFACIDSAGRHYPHHDAQGTLDLPHLRAALSRIGDPSNVQCGRRHLEAHAQAAGVGS